MTAHSNPIVLQYADPWVLKADGEYWFTTSGPEYDRITIRYVLTTGDLQEAPEAVVWCEHEFGICSKYIWVPKLYRTNSTWYIYFAGTEHEFEPNDMPTYRMFVLENIDADPIADS